MFPREKPLRRDTLDGGGIIVLVLQDGDPIDDW